MNKGLVLITFLLTLIVVSCEKTKIRDHYSGFVVDEAGMPISGVVVKKCFSDGSSDTTNDAGFFKIKKDDNFLHDLIFSKKGYRTDTVEMVWRMHGEKVMYSDLITSDSSKWVMREIIYRDSILNWSDKLRIFENDSIEMRRDERVMHTQYLNRGKGEVVYRYYDYHGATSREVYNIDMKVGQVHFRDFYEYDKDGVENIGYLSSPDSIPNPLNEDWSKYKYISVKKTAKAGQLLSETYLSWESLEDLVVGYNNDYILRKEYNNSDNTYQLTKYMDDGRLYWSYYPNGQLHTYGDSKSLYGAFFLTFHIFYDSLGHKVEDIGWEHFYPEWGESYNDTFSVATTREYYPNGKLKSLTKTKSFCESDPYRCGTWIYYDEKGKILRTEKYGNCYNFKLEDKYNDTNFTENE